MIPSSGRRIDPNHLPGTLRDFASGTIYLQPLQLWGLVRAACLCVRRGFTLSDILVRVIFQGKEPIRKRLRALLHTWLGAYYALVIKKSGPTHIHAHHGYFASWVAMVAARLLGASFSLTLHGSDLLQGAAYLDVKLANCSFCFTISEYNRRYLQRTYPETPSQKILVQHMGVDVPQQSIADRADGPESCMLLLSVGRLHAIKDHAFLVRACALLKQRGTPFFCLIAGDGPERKALEKLIARLGLTAEVKLLGHVDPDQLDLYYLIADLVVLTSRSEGIPLVLMEAMAREKIVLAPAITGIPELVVHGETGFLFQSGSLDEFVKRIEWIRSMDSGLGNVRRAARERVLAHFERTSNLEIFSQRFIAGLGGSTERALNENPVLQQI